MYRAILVSMLAGCSGVPATAPGGGPATTNKVSIALSPACNAPVLDGDAWSLRPVVDGTACGPSDCESRSACRAGRCTTEPARDGDSCRTGCDSGTCSAGTCVRVEEGLHVAWSRASTPGKWFVDGPMDHDGNVYWFECQKCAPNLCDTPSVDACRAVLGDDPTFPFYARGVSTSDPASCELVSVDPDGQERYRVALDWGRPWGSVVAGDVLVFPLRATIEARRLSDGARVWRTELEGGSVPDTDLGQGEIHSPVLAGTIIHAARNATTLGGVQFLGFDVRRGKVVYRRDISDQLLADPATDSQGNVYWGSVNANPGRMRSFTATGAPRWDVPDQGETIEATNGNILFTTGDARSCADGRVAPLPDDWAFLASDGVRVVTETNNKRIVMRDLATQKLLADLPSPDDRIETGWRVPSILDGDGLLILRGGLHPAFADITIVPRMAQATTCPVSPGIARARLTPGRLTLIQSMDLCAVEAVVTAIDVPDLSPSAAYQDLPWPQVGVYVWGSGGL